MAKKQHGSELSPVEMAQMLDEFANRSRDGEFREFAEYVSGRVHRTIQQKIMRMFLLLVERWADAYDSRNFDLRNEAALTTAKAIVTATGDRYGRYMPLI